MLHDHHLEKKSAAIELQVHQVRHNAPKEFSKFAESQIKKCEGIDFFDTNPGKKSACKPER